MDKKPEDVQAGSSTTTDADKDKSKTDAGGGNDKDKNFAELRKQLDDANKELETLKGGSATKQDDGDKDEPTAAEKVVFDRDHREAVIQFSGKVKLTEEQKKALTEKVALTGKEVPSEIIAKYQEAYEALPEVKAAREKALIDKGRREAMGQFRDDEMDLGGGGDTDAGADTQPRISNGDAKFAKAMGMSDKAIKAIDLTAETNEWSPGKEPTRKAWGAAPDAE